MSHPPAASTVQPAMQFDDLAQQRLAATFGMWLFLATETMFFGGMFAGYTVYRMWYPQAWAAGSRHLDLMWGGINTAVLLTSSLTMAFAVHAAARNDRRGIMRFLAATIGLAVVFLGIKGYEYYHKWHDHLIPGPHFEWPQSESAAAGPAELFFSFYFAMTGCHALHMIIGIGVLSVLWWQARGGRFSPDNYNAVENAGLYWHFVDIIWVFLLPLLYLIDRT